MHKATFVTGLFLLGIGGLVLGLSKASWGWGLLGLGALALGVLAAGTRAQEREQGSDAPSGRFFVYSMLALAGGFALIIALSRA